jgi:hypothetical protein
VCVVVVEYKFVLLSFFHFIVNTIRRTLTYKLQLTDQLNNQLTIQKENSLTMLLHSTQKVDNVTLETLYHDCNKIDACLVTKTQTPFGHEGMQFMNDLKSKNIAFFI